MTQEKPRFDEDKIFKEEQTVLNCYSGKKRGTISTLFRFYKGNYKNLILGAPSVRKVPQGVALVSKLNN